MHFYLSFPLLSSVPHLCQYLYKQTYIHMLLHYCNCARSAGVAGDNCLRPPLPPLQTHTHHLRKIKDLVKRAVLCNSVFIYRRRLFVCLCVIRTVTLCESSVPNVFPPRNFSHVCVVAACFPFLFFPFLFVSLCVQHFSF
ncbi:hypothetical protein, unlikely [Trypanosoma brucei gambiense DAL972]|uniref:Uncharacterized protein n=1 Tax=Trypanosoma brucei gambiense (strain MHOM/CI/86/DAL972) TaxID=679716 RepID=C9ZSD8_TRYB9|nr:hypothetical protein, unlikely [Trypanosoma brucei gambiense DAL972]CBH12276.1 hypothetical protein, unlikely [Trypanosoma brucei gambiense DAL972]|eukprot:XP_011774557.1 hypothetical protein, unlikely [Trypanosoma brucei gambiense DAL972]